VADGRAVPFRRPGRRDEGPTGERVQGAEGKDPASGTGRQRHGRGGVVMQKSYQSAAVRMGGSRIGKTCALFLFAFLFFRPIVDPNIARSQTKYDGGLSEFLREIDNIDLAIYHYLSTFALVNDQRIAGRSYKWRQIFVSLESPMEDNLVKEVSDLAALIEHFSDVKIKNNQNKNTENLLTFSEVNINEFAQVSVHSTNPAAHFSARSRRLTNKVPIPNFTFTVSPYCAFRVGYVGDESKQYVNSGIVFWASDASEFEKISCIKRGFFGSVGGIVSFTRLPSIASRDKSPGSFTFFDAVGLIIHYKYEESIQTFFPKYYSTRMNNEKFQALRSDKRLMGLRHFLRNVAN